ncbi:MAG: DUF1684 domain-containing protein, partial [Thermomicrobiales bacterium]
QQSRFAALNYFPENEALAVVLPVDREGAGDTIVVDTSDHQPREYVRYGTITFPIAGKQETFTLLGTPGQSKLFLPFIDATSGTETYYNGRYLEPHLRPDGDVEVDFNYAYNPYCAYGEGWSCPVPPDENRITSRIEAGEKQFTLD